MEWISVEPTVTKEEILERPEYALGKLDGAQRHADAWEPGAGVFSIATVLAVAGLGKLAGSAIARSALPYSGLINMAWSFIKPKIAPKEEADK